MVGVIGGEGVFKLTRSADPGLKSEVNSCVWVENCGALLTRNRLILHKSQIFNILHWCIEAAYWNDNSGSSNLVARPKIPAEAHSVFYFALVKVH